MGHTSLRLFIFAAALSVVLPLGAATLPSGPQDLGGLGGSPNAIHVVGVSSNGTLAGGAERLPQQNMPFVWTAGGGFNVIGTTPGYAAASNNLGQATGVLQPEDQLPSAFLYTPPSAMTTISSSIATNITPMVINDAGQVAGTADMTATGEQHIFLWSISGGFKDLGGFGGGYHFATDINENGLVVGHGRNPNGDERAFQSKNGGKIKDLGTLGGSLAQATAVNDNGVIVGYSRTADNNLHGFVYKNNRMTALASTSLESYANAINSSGMIVGSGMNFGVNVAMTWSAAGVPQEIAGADIAVAVNDLGTVALYGGTYPGQSTRAYLWSATTGLMDGGSADDQRSQAIGVTADGRLVASRFDWSGVDKVYVWSPGTGRTLIDGIPNVWSRGLFVNATGKVAGISRTKRGFNRAFLWTPSTTGGGAMVEVPAPDGWHSAPVGLNASGAVAGTTDKSQAGLLGPSFYWPGTGTAFSDLGPVMAVGVNDFGQVAGFQQSPATGAFVWKTGVFTTIPAPGAGYNAYPADLNNHGQVVGRFNIDPWTIHAFSWKLATGSADLGTLGGVYSEAVAVNDAGQIAGNSTLPGETVTHAYRKNVNKPLTDLGSLTAGGQSTATAMNKNGVVVGCSNQDGSVFRAFLYDTKMKDIGFLDYPDRGPKAINDSKDAIGWRLVEPFWSPRGYVSHGGAPIVDLPGMVGNSYAYSRAFGLNASGVAVGDALDADNFQHAVLWRTR